MNIDDLIKLLSVLNDTGDRNTGLAQEHGKKIVVLDKGFVYVGNLSTDSEWLYISNAQNIRRWGTCKGLGQLALEGPLEKTRLDNTPNIKAPISELKHMIDIEVSKW